jgi:hypothetical protein
MYYEQKTDMDEYEFQRREDSLCEEIYHPWPFHNIPKDLPIPGSDDHNTVHQREGIL